MEMTMTLVEMVNSDPQLCAMPTTPAAFAASLTTAGVAGAVATTPAIGRVID